MLFQRCPGARDQRAEFIRSQDELGFFLIAPYLLIRTATLVRPASCLAPRHAMPTLDVDLV